jgi:hypothetical protein
MHGDCVSAFPSWLRTQCRNLCAWDPFAHRCRPLMSLLISFIVNALHLSANRASTNTFSWSNALIHYPVILYYDYVLTFTSEVEHFWGAPLTLGNVLFFINRYFTLFTTLIFLGIRTVSAANEVGCRVCCDWTPFG